MNAARTKGSRSSTSGETGDGLGEGPAAHTAFVPDGERERRRRVGALRGHSGDSTHPPTHLRRACLPAVPRPGPARRRPTTGWPLSPPNRPLPAPP